MATTGPRISINVGFRRGHVALPAEVCQAMAIQRNSWLRLTVVCDGRVVVENVGDVERWDPPADPADEPASACGGCCMCLLAGRA